MFRHLEKYLREKFPSGTARITYRGAKTSKSEHHIRFDPARQLSIEKMVLIPNTAISLRLLTILAPEILKIREIIEKSELLTNLKETRNFVTFRYLQRVETILFENSVEKYIELCWFDIRLWPSLI